MKIEEDAILGEFFDTPEKKAKWMKRLTYLYIAWIIFVIVGVAMALIYL
ncbi:MAG: hypothetical protein J7L58_06685 [Thermoplasmata archaeon]|nr:hypothetical protein [Thermoplasmata archaeon]